MLLSIAQGLMAACDRAGEAQSGRIGSSIQTPIVRSFEAEEQPVIALARRIDRLSVHEHRVDDAAHLDQLLPIAAVAGEARHLPRRYRADLAEADLGDHPLKASPRNVAGGRATEIVVDDRDLGPAEGCKAIAHGILQGPALAIVQHLMVRGLRT